MQAGAVLPVRSRRLAARLGVCVLVVAALHLMLLDRIGSALRIGSDEAPSAAAITVRTIAAAAPAEAEPASEGGPEPGPPPAAGAAPEPDGSPTRPPKTTAPPPRHPVDAGPVPPATPLSPAESAASGPVVMAAPLAAAASAATSSEPASAPAFAEAVPAAAPTASSPAIAGAPALPVQSSVDGAITASYDEPVPTFLAAGESPPPVYPTLLPAPATLHYEVRRGVFSGTGEVRWIRSGGADYTVSLEARIAGISVITQSSTGTIDENGLAPERFTDQRARRPSQAANFRRALGRIEFSGASTRWPLLAGSQDRLSWLIQLAGIAAARPERMVEGSTVAMVVASARGNAEVWSLRVTGGEDAETATGSVRAVKLAGQAGGVAGTRVEVWLDPARAWLPAHATLRNAAGAVEYELLLERIEPAP